MTAVEFLDPRLPESFWSKVLPDAASGCWNWTGSRDRLGYGRAGKNNNGSRLSHRLAYTVLIGDVAAGLDLDHLCRNPSCCNPAHLEPVSHQENIRRSPLIGKTKNPSPFCPVGHEFTPENTLYKKATDRHGTPVRWRICKTCNRRWCAEYAARRKARTK